ncbi:MAG: hypothetical protein J1E16_09095 [Muribaculaceae bacterium]|nr:hypothetical protein [Muribaculaceae bacterium]
MGCLAGRLEVQTNQTWHATFLQKTIKTTKPIKNSKNNNKNNNNTNNTKNSKNTSERLTTPEGLNKDNPWQETSEMFAAWGDKTKKKTMPLSTEWA